MEQNFTGKKPLYMRILLFPVTRIIIYTILITLAVGVTKTIWNSLVSSMSLNDIAWLNIPKALLILAILFYTYYFLISLVEKRKPDEVSSSLAPKEFLLGLLLGSLMSSGVIFIMAIAGFYKITGFNSWMVLIAPFSFNLVVGFYEELVFRVVLFKITEEKLGTWIAVIFSSLLFGFGHISNPNATVWSSVAITLEAGFMLAMIYIYTRRIWAVFGFHFIWNFSQVSVFSVPVSGTEASGLLETNINGPELFTGGEFGPEASVIAVFFGITTGIVFMILAIRKGNIICPYWIKNKNSEIVS